MKNVLFIICSMVILFVGCSSLDETSDQYTEIRQLAWQYVEKQGWERLVSSSWQSAIVEKRVLSEKAAKDAELSDSSFVGTELLWVTFPSGFAPTIIIDERSKEVIGYIQEK
ncbi:hypothetical protein [Bacillus sp. Marseille-P3661]|uniref:hypothetical protein n=1 Tax=Bacillus sp. Marseille-P3661 TaxID=1936234 RepID=UPI000C84E556|nr:hypothetical protein [Bacillus sp. Marseille-P3661]